MRDGDSASLVFEGQLPIAFHAIANIPNPGSLSACNERNEHALRSSLLPNEPVEVEDNDEISQHLRRQEAKLDLLLDLVSTLLARQGNNPGTRQVRLSAEGVRWQDGELAFALDDCIEVEVHMTPGIPQALKFYGKVIAAEAGMYEAEFYGVSQQVVDLLEKLIFRHHRRAVAQQRLDR
jgi:hypothetical protein